ncbi:MAG: TetR family transcriptional regulator [Gammaproteobacteria bacterium]|nr:MAG: TetR family transcriptional regulator [Gammaproteobacteria bacterium]
MKSSTGKMLSTKQISSKGELTRLHIIEVGAKLIHQQGFNNTGLQQILKEAKVTKGSFYFHFADKNTFGLAVIDHFSGFFRATSAQLLANDELSAGQKLQAFHHHFRGAFERMGFHCGCPIGNLSQEMADISPEFAQKVNAAFTGMTVFFTKILLQGIASGEFKQNLAAKPCASFIVNSWEGAVLRMKSVQTPEPLDNWFSFIKEIILPT